MKTSRSFRNLFYGSLLLTVIGLTGPLMTFGQTEKFDIAEFTPPKGWERAPRDGAVVYEVGAQQYAPILAAHPELIDILAKLMVNRLDERRTRLDARAAARERAAIARRIRGAFTTAGPTRNVSRR